jgi:exopolyphosphatase / guanosine-5'-triphosphate,3'-diphosphate pyrophosphatase
MRKIGIIDLGSNSIRLLVVGVYGQRVVTLLSKLIETRLGERLCPGGNLFPPARQRTLDALLSLFVHIKEEDVKEGLIVATSAVREARDGGQFLEKIREYSFLPVRLLTPEEEAHYGFLGAMEALGSNGFLGKHLIVLDLGGRSSELSWEDSGNFSYRSFSFGAVSLQEQFSEERESGDLLISRLTSELGDPSFLFKKELVGLGGTVTTLAALALGLEHYEPGLVHGYLLKKEEIKKWKGILAESSPGQRRLLLPFAPQRADIITAGTSALLAIMEYINKESLTVSEEGLLLGVIRHNFL